MIKQAKKHYFKENFATAKGNMKKTWNLVNCAVGRVNKKSNIDFLISNDQVLNDTFKMCNVFNEYFINIVSELKYPVDQGNNLMLNCCRYLDRNPSTCYFKPITCTEIIDIVSNIKSDCSPGYDDISIKVKKKSIHVLCQPICAIFNQWLDLGIFPDDLKIARVFPVYKNGSSENVANYRPISVLPIFSKILEKCMYNRLFDFISKCNILSLNQYGFRPGHSTSSALIDFVHTVTALDNKKYMIAMFLDLKKAFDTVDHAILLHKLELYGIRGIVLKLFESYLSNRKQYVEISKCKSQQGTISCGVPQGSILGPLLFILFINDLSKVSKVLHCTMFADDTSLFLSHINYRDLHNLFNSELELISEWFYANKMIINVAKTSYIIFSNLLIPDYLSIRVECAIQILSV